MLTMSKWLLLISGGLLIVDSILMFTGKANPLFGWPLPCPVTLTLLGLGTILFGLSSKAFEKLSKDLV